MQGEIERNKGSNEPLAVFGGDYKYDPGHSRKPEGGGWRPTDCGWTRHKPKPRKTPKPKAAPPVPVETIPLPPPSRKLGKRLAAFAKTKYRGFFNYGMANFEEASAEVDAIVGDQRAANPDLNHLIRAYADHKMEWVVPTLSAHISRLYELNNTATDYRTRGVKNLPPSPPGLLRRLSKLISYEQAVIRAAGLVNPDGTVTLYRNCGKEQLGEVTAENCRVYHGSNVESWSLRPNLKWAGTKITANVPLKYCLASCIGRKDRPFQNPWQSEIVVCGSFVDNARLVPKKGRKELMEITTSDLRNNMVTRLLEKAKCARTAASVDKATLFAVETALLSLARAILCNKTANWSVYYGMRPIDGRNGDCSKTRRSIVAKPKNKTIRVEDDPFGYFLKKTKSMWKAIKLADKWEEEHGIEPSGVINTNTPEDGLYLAQMRRWTTFVTSRGYDIAEEREAVYRRLWREFIAEEHRRDPRIPLSEWDD